ncbi:acetolactate synthase isozyme 1 large subunit [bacterium BMS3Bbin12]|nr:acetolactate synthase isozyme 1 large subunit [bacterium BMS3Bbin12]GBE50036.1 acetolactate synthase isozyme 1 large subunit [bacterium BMS3Bbin13]
MSLNSDAPEGARETGDRSPGLPKAGLEVGDRIVQYLEQLGVEYVFGVPGGAIEPLYNALARSARRGGPRPVLARHETGAAFMADGYARETGRLGVCCATTGPGATNLLTGVATAYENEIPLLVITAQTPLQTFGRGAFQESSCSGVNTVAMFRHCTRYSSLVSHSSQLDTKIAGAILSAQHSPRGPAHLSIPLDLLRTPVDPGSALLDLRGLAQRPELVDRKLVDTLCEHLLGALRVVMLIGPGCGGAAGLAMEVAAELDARVVVTPGAKGLVSAYHPRFHGVFGMGGHRSARELLCDPAVDCVLAIGTTLGEWASGAWDEVALLNPRLIHIDDNAEHFARSPMARLHVLGDPGGVLAGVRDRISRRAVSRGRTRQSDPRQSAAGAIRVDAGFPHALFAPLRFALDEVHKAYMEDAPLKPQCLMRKLGSRFPPPTRYLVDTGNSLPWAVHYLHPLDRRLAGFRPACGGLFRACLEFAPMGWAIGAAIGTALARPGTPVVCITGDGSVLMNGQELTVAVAEALPVIFVVLNDAALGMVRHGQRLAGAESVANTLPPVDFSAVARAMGAEGHVIRCAADLEALDVDALCARPGPTLLDCRIDPGEVPPIATRMKALRALP